MLTSPRVSPAKSRARCEKEKKKDDEEEASNRVFPPLQDMEMQDPPRDEGAADVEVEAREVPAIEAERTRAEPTVGVRTPLAKEEAEEGKDEEGDSTVSGKLVASAKLTQGLVEVSLLPRSVCEADLFLQALSCNA